MCVVFIFVPTCFVQTSFLFFDLLEHGQVSISLLLEPVHQVCLDASHGALQNLLVSLILLHHLLTAFRFFNHLVFQEPDLSLVVELLDVLQAISTADYS